LSITQLFLLCIRASVALLRYEPRRCVFIVPQCSAAPQNFKRIVGLRLGLLGFYSGAALIATEVFEGELAMMMMAPAEGGSTTSMGLQNRLTTAVAH